MQQRRHYNQTKRNPNTTDHTMIGSGDQSLKDRLSLAAVLELSEITSLPRNLRIFLRLSASGALQTSLRFYRHKTVPRSSLVILYSTYSRTQNETKMPSSVKQATYFSIQTVSENRRDFSLSE